MTPEAGELPRHVAVVGFARTGAAAACALRTRGVQVTAIDDRPTDQQAAEAAAIGATYIGAPDEGELSAALVPVDLVVVSPGVPPTHPVFGLVEPHRVIAEVELAARLTKTPIVAVTGTNGKTTVTTWITAMLQASGMHAIAVGNIGRAFIEALDEPADIYVCEVSSFQLAGTSTFHPEVSVWLNFAEDHLDWHRDLEEYAAAKERIWANQGPSDVAVVNVADPVVMAAASRAAARLISFGPGGSYYVDGASIVGPDGLVCPLDVLPRALPHDIDNTCAALAAAIAAGADPGAATAAIRSFGPLPHRVDLVAAVDGVRFYDDSKATTPSAVIAALAGIDRSVLIAGGRNKGLDLGSIRAYADAHPGRVHAVVAIGEASDEIASAFGSGYAVERATSMHDAVRAAVDLAERGDAILLSPGCASFDWYRSYEERGDDFAREVQAYAATVGAS